MSIRIMRKRCPHCRKVVTFNPSVGKLGLFCPPCGRRLPLPENMEK